MAVKQFSVSEVLTASDTNTYLANSGLVYVGSASVAGATSFFLDSCFSSTYDTYKVLFTSTGGGSAADITMKMRSGGADDSSSVYSYARFYGYSSGGSVLLNSGENGTSVYVGTQLAGGGSIAMEIFSPNKAFITSFTSENAAFQTATPYSFNNKSSGTVNTTTQYTGIKLLSAANMTGTLTVYGYRKA